MGTLDWLSAGFIFLGSITVFPAVLSAQSQADKESDKQPTLSIVDLIDVPGVSGTQISPDGTQILYNRADADWERNKTISHIWRIDADGTHSVQLTNGIKGESSAIWSPDGSQIAFVARRGEDERGQIWIIRNAGGEAIRLSDHPTSVSALSWLPDGTQILFQAKDEKTEAEKARSEIHDNVFRFDEAKKNAHLWKINVADGKTQRLTGGGFFVGGYSVALDGSLIAYRRAPSARLDDRPKAEIWLTSPADTTGGRPITSNDVYELGFQISPDNEKILFWANTDDNLNGYYYNNRLFVAPLEGGAPGCVVCGGTYEVTSARWSADGSDIYFSANTGIRVNLYRLSMDNREVSEFTTGDHTLSNWDYEPIVDVHAFSLNHARNPGDIWLHRADREELTQVTHVFDYLDEDFELPRIKAVEWSGEDGVMIEGLVYLPASFREGDRYPLVVQTHGGPASSDRFRFPRSVNYETVLAAMGYVVFKPNYRGSTGYGDEFLRDMVGHYFNQAHKDVMTGVDYLIERGLVDGDRMAKMGWSAGGHMTNKIITYTDRFKAASSGAGAVNWISMYGQSDVRTYRTPWFGGDPWSEDSPIEQYMADSPLHQVHKVTTPTIVLVGENDSRVPMPQSVELYRALKKNGVPTHLYVAPKQGHGWKELQQRLFKANVELEWFERWVMERSYDWETSPVHKNKGEDD
jgi:dipeptidyl aminopeptidase/acylaminoacyl peptidase